jgi:peptidoglycan/LPS O-acetylase OafA/YrhL
MIKVTDTKSSAKKNMQGAHIRSLTGIRFFAAIWVVLFHFRENLTRLIPSFGAVEGVFAEGHFAVPLFFILSGFILSHSYFSRYSISNHHNFIWLRFCRLWPVHLVTILLLIVYFLSAHGLGIQLGGNPPQYSLIPVDLAMIRCWATRDLSTWNYPSWSIHAEWFAYLFLFPLCFVGVRRLGDIRILCMLAICALLIHGLIPLKAIPTLIVDIFLLFIAGSMIYRIRQIREKEKCSGMIALLSIALAVFAILVDHPGFSRPAIFIALGLLIYSLSFDDGIFGRLLGTRLVVYGGLISYSLYMTHALVGLAFAIIARKLPLHDPIVSHIAGVLLVISTLVVASIFYHLIEEPANSYLRALGKKRAEQDSGGNGE